MGEILRRWYRVRTQAYHYKQVTIPTECSLEPGQKVTVIHDGWMLVVPAGTPVDEAKINEAIGEKK